MLAGYSVGGDLFARSMCAYWIHLQRHGTGFGRCAGVVEVNTFAEYTRSTAFQLSLTQRQVQSLLILADTGNASPYWNYVPYDCLARKGLVRWVGTDIRPKHNSLEITEAGELVVKLLRIAQFENLGSRQTVQPLCPGASL